MRLHRLISLLLLIENKGKVTAKELAEQLETSTRTVYRDIDTLCESGIPLVSEPGVNGGISLMKGYNVGIKQLHQEDILYLYLNGMGIKADRKSDVATRSSSSLLKLKKLLPKEDVSAFDSFVNRFYVDDTPWWGGHNTLGSVDIIIQALWKSSKLAITYKKVDGTASERLLRPYGIVVKNNEWYLVAYCETSNSLRTFKCERITACSVMSDSFMIPDSFSLKDYFIESVQNFHQQRKSLEQYPVTLSLPTKHSYLLKSLEVYSVKENGSELEAIINMYSYECALRDFWNIICSDAVIISPDELKEAVQDRLNKLNELYSHS